MVKLFSTAALTFTKILESLFSIVLFKEGLICDCVGCWIGFNKVEDIIDDVEIVFFNTVESMGPNT